MAGFDSGQNHCRTKAILLCLHIINFSYRYSMSVKTTSPSLLTVEMVSKILANFGQNNT